MDSLPISCLIQSCRQISSQNASTRLWVDAWPKCAMMTTQTGTSRLTQCSWDTGHLLRHPQSICRTIYMLFQLDMRLPIDVEMMAGDCGPEDGMKEDVEETVQLLLEKHSQVFAEVEKISTLHSRSKWRHIIANTCQKNFQLGQKCWSRTLHNCNGKVGNLTMFSGVSVYVIHESLGERTVYPWNQQGDILRKKINITRLKEYKRREPSSQVVKEMHHPTEPSSTAVKEMTRSSGLSSREVKCHVKSSCHPPQ